MKNKSMKKDKLEIGQKVIITKKPNRASDVEVGDLAIECGFSGSRIPPYEGEHQFHSVDLVDTGKTRQNYWVEFLPRDCYQLLTPISR